MRHLSLLPLVFGISAALLAQNPAPSESKPGGDPAVELCTVAGRVVGAADGNPLKSARVTLVPENSRSRREEIYAASSDSDGHFNIKNVPAGRFRFFAVHTGFVEQHYKAGVDGTGPLFSLTAGEKVNDVLFRLIAAAVITGRLSNEDGEPMEGVQVVAMRRPGEADDEDLPRRRKVEMEPVREAESDDRGQYRIFGLKPGEYFLKAEDSFQQRGGSVPVDESYWLKLSLGSEYAPVYYPGVAQVSQAQIVPLKAGEEAQADITMRRVKTVEITGRVIGGAGPAADSFIRLEPADASISDFDRQDTTDEKGNFRLRNVPEGTYYLLAYQRDEGTRVYEDRARQKVEVGGENIDGLTISLGGGITIQGRVKMDGTSSTALDRIQLTLMPADEDGELGGHTEVKKDGSFEFKSVHDGSYVLGVWRLENDAYIKSVRRGPDDVLEKGVQVEGTSSGRIEVTVSSDGAKLDGSVSDDDGPVIGARVRVVPDPLTPYNRLRIHRTATDQTGRFSLTDIAPGKYKLIAKPMIASETGAYKAEPQALTFSENDHKTVEIKMEKPQE